MRGNRHRWIGPDMRREKSEAVKTVMKMNIEGTRGRGRQKKRWLDAIVCDMGTAGVCVDDLEDHVKWRFQIQVVDPKYLG